jgi:SH3-like domain-containing protein
VIKIIIAYLFSASLLYAQASDIGSATGFKIPRFVSLKSNEVNMRIGSGTIYPIVLQYTTKNFPLEVIEEYDLWRKVKDIEGNEGWIKKTLLKGGDRFGIIIEKEKINALIFSKPRGKIIGEIGKNNIVLLDTCLLEWCFIEFNKYEGWVNKKSIWGVYKDEEFNKPFYQLLINQIWKIILPF